MNYDTDKTEFLCKGFAEGFDIGYEGPMERQSLSDNIPLRLGTKTQLWNKLMKEVKLKRVTGPFDTVPFKKFHSIPNWSGS